MDLGGVPYLVPLAQKHKVYDMRDYPKLTGMNLMGEETALIIGAGAAPWTFLDRNAEVSGSAKNKIQDARNHDSFVFEFHNNGSNIISFTDDAQFNCYQ